MADWQVGDLAVYLGNGGCGRHPGQKDAFLCEGRAYRVISIRVRHSPCRWACLAPSALVLAEDASSDAWRGFCCESFRKIRPDEQQACEPEFVQLLKLSKQTVSA